MNKKKKIILMLLLVTLGFVSSYAIDTYAKYNSKVEKGGSATVAKWSFATDNATATFEVPLAKTYDASTLTNGKIAPGTEGSFNIALSNVHSEVGVDWTIELKSITNIPTNLKFYKTRTGSGTNESPYVYSNEVVPGNATTGKITGQLVAEESNTLNVPIYWKWEYETSSVATNDPLDTTDGEAARTLTIGVDVTGVQVQPGTSITSHIN